MSLISLPAELDYKIINFLGHDRLALSRLSKVSKYYRKQTEARLYEKIAPDVNIETHILLELLRTLVSRPSLALHIKSFDMTHAERQLPQPASSHNENWLFRYVPPDSRYYPPNQFKRTITERIKQVVREEVASSAKTKLQHNLQCTHIASYIALVLCMSKNLEHLQICRPQGADLKVLQIISMESHTDAALR
jgi:hypothetical protein